MEFFSAPCCFKTTVTGGNQDLVPAALRTSFGFVCPVMTFVLVLSTQTMVSRRREFGLHRLEPATTSLCVRVRSNLSRGREQSIRAVKDLMISFP
jgi:hypothetical protein